MANKKSNIYFNVGRLEEALAFRSLSNNDLIHYLNDKNILTKRQYYKCKKESRIAPRVLIAISQFLSVDVHFFIDKIDHDFEYLGSKEDGHIFFYCPPGYNTAIYIDKESKKLTKLYFPKDFNNSHVPLNTDDDILNLLISEYGYARLLYSLDDKEKQNCLNRIRNEITHILELYKELGIKKVRKRKK